jgi:hypothetical protein
MFDKDDVCLPLDGSLFSLSEKGKQKVIDYSHKLGGGKVSLRDQSDVVCEFGEPTKILEQIEAFVCNAIEPEFRRLAHRLSRVALKALEERTRGMDACFDPSQPEV